MASAGLTATGPGALEHPAQAFLERASADGVTQKALEALGNTEGWRRWLGVRCHFGNLALINQAGVAHARPHAKHVAGRRTWQTLGYEVHADAKPTHLWARSPSAGEPVLVPVFDQDQVRPVATSPEPPPNGDQPNLIGFLGQLIKFAAQSGAPVTFEPIAGAMRSYHEPGTGAIVIDASPDHPLAARAHHLAYELAVLLIDEDPHRARLSMAGEERALLARSVAYAVCPFARSPERLAAIAVPAEWERDGSMAVRYAALTDRVAARLEAALIPERDGEQQ